MQRMIEICNILLRYVDPHMESCPFWANRNVIGFIVDPEIISNEDLLELQQLGVIYDPDASGLVLYI